MWIVRLAILSQNIVRSPGTAKMGSIEYDVAINSSPEILSQLNEIPIRYVNGAIVYLRDVAFVHDGYTPQTKLVRRDGRHSALLPVLTSGSASTLSWAPNVKAGMPVRVSVRGRLLQPVTGAVTSTANAIDPGTRTLLAEVDIPNASHDLLPGMFVYVGFKIGTSGTRWRVPATAVVIDADGTRVVTVGARNALHFQPVVLGRDFGDSIDIQAGLHGGETIVKQPTVSYQEGQVVRPIPPSPAGG